MLKWRKRIPILVLCVSVLAIAAWAVNELPTQAEQQKAERIEQLKQESSVEASQPIHPDVAAKQAMEAEVQNKLSMEMFNEEIEPMRGAEPYKPHHEGILTTKDNERGIASIRRPVVEYDPRAIYFEQDFEDTLFPPTGWDTVNTDPGYGFFLGTYTGGGTQSALVTWHAPGFQQDEWLISPTVDVSGAASNLRLEFWFLKGYTYPHKFYVWVSTDGGTNYTEIFDADTTGYPTFTWWKYTIDMSAYAGESQLTVGFNYYGIDADLFGIDDIVLTDDAPPVGRCCYGDPFSPDCQDVTEADCNTLGGSWSAGLNCTDDPCPIPEENDSCHTTPVQLLPYTFTGDNTAATFDTYCQYFGEYPNVWVAFELEVCMSITIEYCGSPAGWGNGWLNLVTDCDCPDGSLLSYSGYDFNCGNGNPQIYFDYLDPGIYYYPVMLDPANGAIGNYELYVYGEECPPPTPGDNCGDPFPVSVGSGDLPYTIASQYTCGRLANYDVTCLGSYDGGEDLIVELTVTDDLGFVNLTLDPKGTTWSGMSIDNECPDLDGTCLGTVTSSSGSPKTIPNLELLAGTYYIQVDTWPSPDCIPDLDIIIEAAAGPQEGDNCANPIKVDIPTLPFHDYGQTTCGRVDDYDTGCLGLYDGGEDIIYEITVLSAVTVNITLDPLGTSYTGMALSTDCPGADPCLYEVGTSSSLPKGFKCVALDPGVYYLMVDTWPSPDCIPAFDLHITDTTCAALENDDCADATEVGEVTDLAFSTQTATYDGGGTCMTSPNIWYCYTPSMSGKATISLCGSGYDTKLAVYDGCVCSPLGPELACNDDACGLQSEVELNVTAGNSYLIEVGGYSSNTGEGILNITVEDPCEVTCTGTDEGEPCTPDEGTDVTNGGCNSSPPVFGSIDCGETVCGEWNTYLFGGSNYRDTDWYTLTLDNYYDVTITAVGEFPIVTGFLEQVIDGGGWDCGNFTGSISPYGTGEECDTVVVQRLAMGPGDYAIFVGGTVFTGFPCSAGPFEYSVTVECVPAVPTYCAASGGCDEYIENVTFQEIDNTTACDGYGDYTALVATVEAGGSYPISITIGGAYSLDTAAVYVDWNQDLDFDDPGETATLNPGAGYGPYSGTVDVPLDALGGETRMRIRLAWNTNPGPCGSYSYGEVEDYTVSLGEAGPTYLYLPDPLLVIAKFSLDPQSAHIYISSEAVGGVDVNDMENLSLEVAGCGIPISSTEIIPGGFGELTGDVLHLAFPAADHVLCEEANQGGLIWGNVDSFFDIEYDLSGGPSGNQFTGEVTIRGHVAGDLNIDGEVNVTDLTLMVDYLFKGGDAPLELKVADVNASGGVPDVTDLSYLVDYLFKGGPVPVHQ